MKKTIMAGITKDNEIYFLEIEPISKEHKYFSMSGFTVNPIKESEAIERNREQLEDGDFWRQAVEAKETELSLDDWVEYVIDNDGETSLIDTSLFTDTIEINGETWLFESSACGQHEEKDLKHYFIEKSLFKNLMAIWKKYHLKRISVKLPKFPIQDTENLLIEAVKTIIE
jgi:hypothetical protein